MHVALARLEVELLKVKAVAGPGGVDLRFHLIDCKSNENLVLLGHAVCVPLRPLVEAILHDVVLRPNPIRSLSEHPVDFIPVIGPRVDGLCEEAPPVVVRCVVDAPLFIDDAFEHAFRQRGRWSEHFERDTKELSSLRHAQLEAHVPELGGGMAIGHILHDLHGRLVGHVIVAQRRPRHRVEYAALKLFVLEDEALDELDELVAGAGGHLGHRRAARREKSRCPRHSECAGRAAHGEDDESDSEGDDGGATRKADGERGGLRDLGWGRLGKPVLRVVLRGRGRHGESPIVFCLAKASSEPAVSGAVGRVP
mmetsp:Transcript_17546/g.40161  ORF Transcript_17546/g.40161 Transcript_17546/m.40161 type:complete len:310 (-) Transcript_17546:115-1044(-)